MSEKNVYDPAVLRPVIPKLGRVPGLRIEVTRRRFHEEGLMQGLFAAVDFVRVKLIEQNLPFAVRAGDELELHMDSTLGIVSARVTVATVPRLESKGVVVVYSPNPVGCFYGFRSESVTFEGLHE